MNWLSKFVGFRLRKRKINKLYKQSIGGKPNLINPVSNYDKIQYRKLFGNHAFYALLADKYRVREFVARRAGEKYLIPLLGVFDRLTPDALMALPAPFIIKCNNGCDWNRIVKDKELLDIDETVKCFNKTCRRKYSRESGERHYDFIEPKIVVEKLLDDNGEPLWDYSVWSYNGRNGFDYTISIGSPDLSFRAHFDRDWNVLETNFSGEQMKKYANPENAGEMIEVARLLSEGIDFVRVDLYNINGTIYFGELTFTPHSGLGRIENKLREKMRDEMWEIALHDRRLYQKQGWIAD